jgi:Cof subfamily protein (haloacid dehalogenase superfamily)
MTLTTTLPAGLLPGGRFDQWQPRPVRYVVCDVDGTLIGPEELSTPAVAQAIERAQAAGIRVGFATGRMRDGVSGLQRQLGARGPHVLHNGAEVRADGTTVASWTLTPQQVDALLALAHEHEDLYLEVYGESGFHVSAMDERARPHWDLLRAEPLGVLRQAAELGDMPVPKATFAVFTDAALEWLEERLASLDAEVGSAGSPRTPGLVFTNVNRPGATKGAAIAAAAEHLAIGTDAVAAIGDAGNDRSMLAVAGTAIAMGQAEPEIIAAAHLVTRSVDDDGVAAALDALIAWSAPG